MRKRDDCGSAVLAAWGVGILTGLRMARNGEPTDEIEASAKYALAVATGTANPTGESQ